MQDPTYDDIRHMPPPEFQAFISQKVDAYHGEVVSMSAVQEAHGRKLNSLCNFRAWVMGGLAAIGAGGVGAWLFGGGSK